MHSLDRHEPFEAAGPRVTGDVERRHSAGRESDESGSYFPMRAGRSTQNLHSPSSCESATPTRTPCRREECQSTSQMAVAVVMTPRPIESPMRTFVRACMDCPVARFAAVGWALKASSAESVEKPEAVVVATATPVSTPPPTTSQGDAPPPRPEGGAGGSPVRGGLGDSGEACSVVAARTPGRRRRPPRPRGSAA